MKKALLLILSLFLINCEESSSYIPSIDEVQPQPKPTPEIDPFADLNCLEAPEVENSQSSLIDFDEIERQLENEGLTGWVHAAHFADQMFVFTWRHPQNFFVNVQLPMTTYEPDVISMMGQLRRHDKVLIKGKIIKNQAPIRHIEVTSLQEVTPYTGKDVLYTYRPGVKEGVMTGTALTGKIHTIVNEGAVIVVEVEDRVFPVFNSKPELAKNLFRNDKIAMKYQVRGNPKRPMHLGLDVNLRNSLCLIERIEEGHGEEIELTGPVVMFPQSPQIIFDVFALRTEDEDGVQRNYTLVNFSDPDVFKAVREKLEKAWYNHENSAVYDRNKYLNKKLIVTAKGTKNVVDPVQANPQILLESADDIEIRYIGD